MSSLDSLYLHEIVVVILSEIIFINIKSKSMKNVICKISLHMILSWLLTHLVELIFLVGGQTIPTGRFDPARN